MPIQTTKNVTAFAGPFDWVTWAESVTPRVVKLPDGTEDVTNSLVLQPKLYALEGGKIHWAPPELNPKPINVMDIYALAAEKPHFAEALLVVKAAYEKALKTEGLI